MKKIYYLALIFSYSYTIDLSTEIWFDPIKYGNKVYAEKDPKSVAVTQEKEKKEIEEMLNSLPRRTTNKQLELEYLLREQQYEPWHFPHKPQELYKSNADRH